MIIVFYISQLLQKWLYSVQSSLSATGWEHACPDEPLIFTCEANGQLIQWTLNTFYCTTFFYDHNVNSVQTVSGQHGVRAVLTGNDPIPKCKCQASIICVDNSIIMQLGLVAICTMSAAPLTQRHTLSTLKLLVRCESLNMSKK